MELKVGRCYRSKKPAVAGGFFVNDREIKYISDLCVQYDGPSVPIGRRYPSISKEKFLAWAERDVTDELPAGEWMSWYEFTKQ